MYGNAHRKGQWLGSPPISDVAQENNNLRTPRELKRWGIRGSFDLAGDTMNMEERVESEQLRARLHSTGAFIKGITGITELGLPLLI